MKTLKVAVLGAGFSGLTLAYALQKKGIAVEVFESQAFSGGLIQTSFNKVLVESAAHALLATAEVEELFKDLNVELVKAGYVSNSKWIFRGKPLRWPLTFKESLKSLGIPTKPKPQETVAEWVQRNFSSHMNEFVVAPAFQGVYGAQTDVLSANLILSREIKIKKGKLKGSVAPLNGMVDLIHKLTNALKVNFNSKKNIADLNQDFDVVVIATGIGAASDLLRTVDSDLSEKLSTIPKVSLLSATIALTKPSDRPSGFGCLFPRSEGFESLGVLFNSDIFPKRGKNSETWIFEGEYPHESAQNLLKKILSDRKRIDPTDIEVNFCEIHRWPQVLPLYGLNLEKLLKAMGQGKNVLSEGAQVTEKVYLTGNYLGGIGLAKILSYNNRLANRILKDHV